MNRALARLLSLCVMFASACGSAPRGDVGAGSVRPDDLRWVVENRSDETLCYVQIDAAPASFTQDRLDPGEVIAPGASRSWPFVASAERDGFARLFDCNKQVLFQRALPLSAPAVITFDP